MTVPLPTPQRDPNPYPEDDPTSPDRTPDRPRRDEGDAHDMGESPRRAPGHEPPAEQPDSVINTNPD